MLHIDIHKRLDGSKGSMELTLKLEIEQGSFVAIMGESGAGKTTLLRAIAGLESYKGDISLLGQSWNDLKPQKRDIGFVFQDYALFEHMSVEENLLYVKNDKKLADKLLSFTELIGLASHNVRHLSGGQKQRVSLCRALMHQPKLLLMDEPLSALDEKMKDKLIQEIEKLHKEFGTTTLMVSHDATASYILANRIIVLHQGKILKDGTKDDVLQKSHTVTYALKR